MDKKPKKIDAEKALQEQIEKVRPEDEERIRMDFNKTLKQVKKASGKFVETMVRNLKILYAMATDKDYEIDWRTKAIAMACLIYVMLPTDIIPDFIPVAGLLDDAAVVALTVRKLRREIQRYQEFKKARQTSQNGNTAGGKTEPPASSRRKN
jgi:uncharacterized membrane protein YkvA (DUF1232 family)